MGERNAPPSFWSLNTYMSQAYSGKFIPQNVEKYMGDPNDIWYRSLWEKKAFDFCDQNPDIEGWGSEITIIPYRCRTDGKMHRYFMDLTLKFKSGHVVLVEIKPNRQIKPPKKPKRRGKNYLKECLTYAKNKSKWETAQAYARERGWRFQIWDEHTLQKLGIKIPNYRSPKRNKNS